MDIDFDMNEISLRDEDTEAVPEIIVSVMSMMRKKWEYNITASSMELDEDATMELKEGHEDNEPNNSSDEEENEADFQCILDVEKPKRMFEKRCIHRQQSTLPEDFSKAFTDYYSSKYFYFWVLVAIRALGMLATL
ncbi:hypothetical protein BDF14DRAFT_1878803 [Spinellus fusiger]|nr:hypothetical protein BDF14DRAFT_1878803 [Spinellus fusiger]